MKPFKKHVIRLLFGGLILFAIETIQWGIFNPLSIQFLILYLLFGVIIIGFAGKATNWKEKDFGFLLILSVLTFSILLGSVLDIRFGSSFMALFIVSYLFGAVILLVIEKVAVPFFYDVHLSVKTKRDYKRWLKEKKKE